MGRPAIIALSTGGVGVVVDREVKKSEVPLRPPYEEEDEEEAITTRAVDGCDDLVDEEDDVNKESSPASCGRGLGAPLPMI